MRRRPSARLLPLDEEGRVLLFRFVIKSGPTAGDDYWATAGGEVEEGESFAQAARRELYEETGIVVEDVGEPVAEREFILQLFSGEKVIAEERYFQVQVKRQELCRERWTALEKEVMAEHKWWSVEELKATSDIVYPESLVELLDRSKEASATIPTFGEKQASVDYVVRHGAYAVVLDGERKVAVIRCGDVYFLPGGGCGPHETPKSTLAREVREECGVEIEIGEYLGESIDYLYSASENTHFKKHGRFYLCSFRSPPASSDLVWLSPSGFAPFFRQGGHAWAVEMALKK